MDLERAFERPVLKTARNAAATYTSISLLVTGFVSGCFFVYTFVSTKVEDREALAAIGVSASVLLVAVTVASWCHAKYICDPAPYEILELKGLLIVEPAGTHHRYINTRTETVRAARNNVRLIEHRSHWTGQSSKGRYRVESLVDDHQLFSSRRPEEDGRTFLWVYLGSPLSKGEEAQVEIRETFEDNLQQMHQYYRKGSGRFRARNLTVVARFMVSEEPSKVYGLEWNHDRRSHARPTVGSVKVERIPAPNGETVDYVVVVDNPKPHHSYGIRWMWPARKAPYAASGDQLSSLDGRPGMSSRR